MGEVWGLIKYIEASKIYMYPSYISNICQVNFCIIVMYHNYEIICSDSIVPNLL